MFTARSSSHWGVFVVGGGGLDFLDFKYLHIHTEWDTLVKWPNLNLIYMKHTISKHSLKIISHILNNFVHETSYGISHYHVMLVSENFLTWDFHNRHAIHLAIGFLNTVFVKTSCCHQPPFLNPKLWRGHSSFPICFHIMKSTSAI